MHSPSCRPILLMMDGHSTHFEPSVIRMAAKEEVILFFLPPHSTHLTQPLDKGCFGPLKAAWKEVCHDYLTRNPGKLVTRYSFSQLFGKAWTCSMNMANVIAGFRTTAIFPFNRNALLSVTESQTPSKFNPKSLCKSTKLKFIPVYSPVQSKPMPPSSPPLYNFTEEEITLFTQRYEEGYDITHDERYNYWLKLKDAKDDSNESGIIANGEKDISIEESVAQESLTPLKDVSKKLKPSVDATKNEPQLLKRSTTLSKVLSAEDLSVVKMAIKTTKTSAQVLTSFDNLKMLEDKEKKKKEQEEEKGKRKEEVQRRPEEAQRQREEKERIKKSKEPRKGDH